MNKLTDLATKTVSAVRGHGNAQLISVAETELNCGEPFEALFHAVEAAAQSNFRLPNELAKDVQRFLSKSKSLSSDDVHSLQELLLAKQVS